MDDRLRAFGNQLVETHIRLREDLDRLRSGAVVGRDLRQHCLAFCAALTTHHAAEDDGAFPVLAKHYPELAPVLDELRRDHVLVAEVLERIAALPEPGDDDPVTTRRELDSLAALLETHLTYEEKKIVSALNRLRPTAPEATAVRAATRWPT